jgi:elongation factor Ts
MGDIVMSINITAIMVKDLRERSGAGMMDCKNALVENGGDIDKAMDWLRKKGLSKAANKAGRIAADGLIGVASEATTGGIVEVNSETDFVARNAQFQDMVRTIAQLAVKSSGDLGKLLAAPFSGKSHTVEEHVKEMVATIGENMSVRRSAALSVKNGVVSTYVHNQAAAGLGKIGVLVALESAGDKAKLAELGRQLAMHIAAANPLAVTIDQLDPKEIEKERAVLTERAIASGKPKDIAEKMVEGQLRKEFFQQAVLMEQTFVIDGKEKVGAILKTAEKTVGAPIAVAGFKRYALGEGIERKTEDFAAEVAKAVKGN